MMLITSGSSRPMPVLKCQLVRQHPDCSAYRRLRLVQAGSSPARVTTAAASLLLQTPLRAPSKRWSGTGSKCNPGPVLPLFSGVWGLAKAQRVQGRALPGTQAPRHLAWPPPHLTDRGAQDVFGALKPLASARPPPCCWKRGPVAPLPAPSQPRCGAGSGPQSSAGRYAIQHPVVCNTRPSR